MPSSASAAPRPRQFPPAEHIKEVEKRVKEATPKMELGERDATGLLGGRGDDHKDEG